MKEEHIPSNALSPPRRLWRAPVATWWSTLISPLTGVNIASEMAIERVSSRCLQWLAVCLQSTKDEVEISENKLK